MNLLDSLSSSTIPNHPQTPVPIVLQEGDGYFAPDGHQSNSKVKSLAHEAKKGEPLNFDYKEPFRYGSLLDVYITEPERFEATFQNLKDGKFCITDEGGELKKFTLLELETIIQNKMALFARFPQLKEAEMQKVIRRDSFAIGKYKVRAKIKCDFYFGVEKAREIFGLPVTGPAIVDLKATTAKTEEEFESRFWKYDYHQQAAFYSDVAGACTFWIVAINRESEIYHFRVAGNRFKAGRLRYTNRINLAGEAGLLDEFLAQKSEALT